MTNDELAPKIDAQGEQIAALGRIMEHRFDAIERRIPRGDDCTHAAGG